MVFSLPNKTKTHREPGRNDYCLCLSGKKYKDCCLKKQQEADRANMQKCNEMWNKIKADADAAVERFKRDGDKAEWPENEVAAIAVLSGVPWEADTSRMGEGIVTVRLKHPVKMHIKDGKFGIAVYTETPDKPSPEPT